MVATVLRPIHFILTPSENLQVRARFERALGRPAWSRDAHLRSCRLDAHRLPTRMRSVIEDFRANGNRDGVLVIDNLPVEPNPGPTPLDPATPATWRPTDVSAWLLGCVGTLLGEPVGYAQEQGGALIQDIFPTVVNAEKLSSQSSVKLLDHHTEQAFHPYRPDYLLLYGVRADHQRRAETFAASIRNIYPTLTEGQRELLSHRLYKTDIDFSFGNEKQRKGGGPLVRVLEGHGAPRLRFDLDLMEGVTLDAAGALLRLADAVRRVQVGFRVLEGTLAILDNHACTHGRGPFYPHFDGTDRWLRRMAVLATLARNPDLRPGTRIVDSDFFRFLKDPHVNE